MNENKLTLAKEGDIEAFNELFQKCENSLKAYLFRLLTNWEDVEDFYHETFVKSFGKIQSFNGEEKQLKTWIFTIATNLSLNHLKKQKRWASDFQDKTRAFLHGNQNELNGVVSRANQSGYDQFEIKDNIDFCFTCVSKTLPLEQQIVLLLKTLKFAVKEIAQITDLPVPSIKNHLHFARKTMSEIYDKRCSLINQQGMCYQCTELLDLFNPKRNAHREVMKLKMAKKSEVKDCQKLFRLREKLIENLNPYESNAKGIYSEIFRVLRKVNGVE